MPTAQNHLPAILWVLLSTGIFSVIFAAAKFGEGVVGTFQILLLRYLGAFGTVILIARSRGPLVRQRSAVPLLHLLRAAFGCCAAASITWASAHMPIVDASAIGMLYGVFAVVLGVRVLRERMDLRQGFAIALSGVGAASVMASQGAFGQVSVLVPVMVALLSATLMACEGVMIRVLSQRDPALSMILYVMFFGICLMAVPALLTWQPVDIEIYLLCFALGPLSVVAQYCTIRGYRTAPLSVVGPVDYSWLLFAMALGVGFFDELPGPGALAGGALIVAGGLILSGLGVRQGSRP